MFLYFYQADSCLIPGTSNKTLGELKKDFVDSVTPLKQTLAVTSRKEQLMCKTILTAWLSTVNPEHTGLIHSLQSAIIALEG